MARIVTQSIMLLRLQAQVWLALRKVWEPPHVVIGLSDRREALRLNSCILKKINLQHDFASSNAVHCLMLSVYINLFRFIMKTKIQNCFATQATRTRSNWT